MLIVLGFFCSGPASRAEVEVPASLKTMWLRRACSQKRVDFLDPGYYLQHFTEYTVWSFEVHTQQVAQVLKLIPKSATIVAPGDGIGIVARQWPSSQVISGDFSRNDLTSKIVELETFQETMNRGAPGNVLLLSYVYSLFSIVEQRMMALWDGPVVVLDNRDVSPGPQFQQIGPGVFVTGFEGQVVGNEDFTPMSSQLFSENLLAIENISFIERNPSVNYWERMRPMTFARRFPSIGPLIIHSLPELARYREAREDVRGAYLTSIGQEFTATVPLYVDVCTHFSAGVVYEIGSSHPVVPTLKKYSHWAHQEGLFLFCFLKNCQVLRQMTTWQVSPLKQVTQLSYPTRLLAYNQGMAYLATMSGVVGVSLFREDVRYGMLLYLEHYSHPSWKDVYASGTLVSRIGSEHVPVSKSLRARYKKRLDPRYFPWSVIGSHNRVDFSELTPGGE